jgi:hypothetical protein
MDTGQDAGDSADETAALRRELTKRYGKFVGGSDLPRLLGIKSEEALRQALYKETIVLTTYRLPNRKGRFALVVDVVEHLRKTPEPIAVPASRKIVRRP